MATQNPERPKARSGREAAGTSAVLLQCVASAAGTLIGEALGPSLAGKLLAGMLGAAVGAFLTAPGKRHDRRIVAVALLLALLDLLRSTADALAADEPRRRPPWAPANWAVVGASAAVGFAIGGGVTTARAAWTHEGSPAVAVVPDVRGASRDRAITALEAARLRPTTALEPSQSVANGAATRTDPPGGTRLREDARVTLFLSTGPPPQRLSVPDVTGFTRARALALLRDTGLHPRTRAEASASIAAGAATRTDPPAGARVHKDAEVRLFVSSGPAVVSVTVPDVKGRPRAGALAVLRRAGLRTTSRTEPSDAIAAGAATRTDPPAGARIDRGGEVTLYLSSGGVPARLTLPDVSGQSEASALRVLGDLGLHPTSAGEASPSVAAGAVTRTVPVAGASVEAGSAVSVFVSSGPPPLLVPSVAGLTEDAARAKLEAAGLVPTTSAQSSSTVAAGTAIGTDPAAGAEVKPGATVSLLVSCGDNCIG